MTPSPIDGQCRSISEAVLAPQAVIDVPPPSPDDYRRQSSADSVGTEPSVDLTAAHEALVSSPADVSLTQLDNTNV